MKILLKIAKKANMLMQLKDESLCIKILSYRNLNDYLDKFVELQECGFSYGFQDLIPSLNGRDRDIFKVEIQDDFSSSTDLLKLNPIIRSDDMLLQCEDEDELLALIRKNYTFCE